MRVRAREEKINNNIILNLHIEKERETEGEKRNKHVSERTKEMKSDTE